MLTLTLPFFHLLFVCLFVSKGANGRAGGLFHDKQHSSTSGGCAWTNQRCEDGTVRHSAVVTASCCRRVRT